MRIQSIRPTLLSIAATMALAAPSHATPVLGQGTWQTTLQARDINGDGTTDAFYDTQLNITWLADGNAAAGSGFDATYGGGRMTWGESRAWAASLNVYGTTGWRWPTMIDTGVAGCDFFSYGGGTDCGYNVQTISADGQTVYSELAHLFYATLGNLAYCAPGSTYYSCLAAGGLQPGWGLTNTANFRNLQGHAYWSGLPCAPLPQACAWVFGTYSGGQGYDFQDDDLYAIAVRPGDVTAATSVPEPTGLALAALALSALVVVRRRRAL